MTFRCPCGETRREAFRASDPRRCKACVRAYHNQRKRELRPIPEAVHGLEARAMPPTPGGEL